MNRPRPQATARSPFAGCAILIAALCVMVFLVVFSVYALFRQYGEIEKFTGDKAIGISVSKVEDNEAAANQLAEKIEAFRQELTGDGEARLALSPEEINLAIGLYEPFKDLRGTFRVQTIDDKLRIAISFPLNGKPRLAKDGEDGWITSDGRFLNGTMVCTPGLLSRELVLQVNDIEVPHGTVPEEFTAQMSPYRIAERYKTDAALGPPMAKLTRVSLENGTLVLARVPGETPQDVITDAQVDKASTRFFTMLGIAATMFLLVAGTIVFIGLKARK